MKKEKTTLNNDQDIQTLAFAVPEFCEAHRISRAFFYALLKAGKGPKTMQVGNRRLISYEAAEAWRRKTEEKQTGQEPA